MAMLFVNHRRDYFSLEKALPILEASFFPEPKFQISQFKSLY